MQRSTPSDLAQILDPHPRLGYAFLWHLLHCSVSLCCFIHVFSKPHETRTGTGPL